MEKFYLAIFSVITISPFFQIILKTQRTEGKGFGQNGQPPYSVIASFTKERKEQWLPATAAS